MERSQLQSPIRNGVIPEWFHGIISRKMAEELLMSKPPGCFLIRVSESRIGYTLSYRGGDHCRHFKIDVLEDGHYVIVGEDRRHQLLQDMVDYHRRTPIKPFMEVLTVACEQNSNHKTENTEHLNHDTSFKPKIPRASHPESQDDIPPALPYRANNPMNSGVPSPKSQWNRINPRLGEDHPLVTSPPAAMPVPKPRKKYAADNIPSNRSREFPAQRCGPPLKQNQAFIRTVSSHTATEHSLCDLGGNTENEHQVISRAQTYSSQCPCTDATDGGLPEEYNPPLPFAPGYQNTLGNN